MMRLFRAGCGALLLALLLAGCGDRQGSIDAALALAESNYPGQLELYATHLQKDHYDIVLAIKGDPVTRIRFGVDRDPAHCRPGTRCEERLRNAYEKGVAAAVKLKALDEALRKCGVPALGIHDAHITPAFRAVIELDLDPADQQPPLDQLTPCIAEFRKALPPDASPEQRSLALRILLPAAGTGTVSTTPLTFETRLPPDRADEPSYFLNVSADDERLSAEKLRLNPHYLSGKELREHLADVARRALDEDPRGGHVPKLSFLSETRLDPQRLDVIRTYILACSEHEPGKGRCKPDMAVAMRYDLKSRDVSEVKVLRDIRNGRGTIRLPRLPGR